MGGGALAARRGGATSIAQFAALGAMPPSSAVAASVTALAVLLLAMALVGLPFAVLAQQISAVPAAELWRTQLPVYALSLCAATVTATCMLVVANRHHGVDGRHGAHLRRDDRGAARGSPAPRCWRRSRWPSAPPS